MRLHTHAETRVQARPPLPCLEWWDVRTHTCSVQRGEGWVSPWPGEQPLTRGHTQPGGAGDEHAARESADWPCSCVWAPATLRCLPRLQIFLP